MAEETKNNTPPHPSPEESNPEPCDVNSPAGCNAVTLCTIASSVSHLAVTEHSTPDAPTPVSDQDACCCPAKKIRISDHGENVCRESLPHLVQTYSDHPDLEHPLDSGARRGLNLDREGLKNPDPVYGTGLGESVDESGHHLLEPSLVKNVKVVDDAHQEGSRQNTDTQIQNTDAQIQNTDRLQAATDETHYHPAPGSPRSKDTKMAGEKTAGEGNDRPSCGKDATRLWTVLSPSPYHRHHVGGKVAEREDENCRAVERERQKPPPFRLLGSSGDASQQCGGFQRNTAETSASTCSHEGLASLPPPAPLVSVKEQGRESTASDICHSVASSGGELASLSPPPFVSVKEPGRESTASAVHRSPWNRDHTDLPPAPMAVSRVTDRDARTVTDRDARTLRFHRTDSSPRGTRSDSSRDFALPPSRSMGGGLVGGTLASVYSDVSAASSSSWEDRASLTACGKDSSRPGMFNKHSGERNSLIGTRFEMDSSMTDCGKDSSRPGMFNKHSEEGDSLSLIGTRFEMDSSMTSCGKDSSRQEMFNKHSEEGDSLSLIGARFERYGGGELASSTADGDSTDSACSETSSEGSTSSPESSPRQSSVASARDFHRKFQCSVPESQTAGRGGKVPRKTPRYGLKTEAVDDVIGIRRGDRSQARHHPSPPGKSSKHSRVENPDSYEDTLTIDDLPDVLLIHVFSFLPAITRIGRVRQVCRKWQSLVSDPSLWRRLDLRNLPRLQDFVLLQLVSLSDRVASLVLSDGRSTLLTDGGVSAVLKKCRYLTKVKLNRCFFLSDDAFQSVGHCHHVVYLNLSGCFTVTDRTLLAVSEGCPLLEDLGLGQCARISDTGLVAVVKRCSRLVSLRLDQCGKLTNAVLEALAEHCPHLQFLHLLSCAVTDTGIAHLSKLVKLKLLDISNVSQVSRRTVESVVECCPLLETLALSLNRTVDDQCVRQAVTRCPKLRCLSCVACGLSDQGLAHIAQHAKLLERLDVAWCGDLTDAGIAAVCSSCPRLRYLGIMRCPLITAATLERLLANHPHIHFSNFELESRRLLVRAAAEEEQGVEAGEAQQG